ncbi:hypothetical protein ASD56_00040 [Microbacterium sp. Root166]|uniref:NeuD/PglB/VioB family sugar acetyltransferase n=1 Tax=Microbacterium sp. Root166 TaxID=1736478 RepID=UPI00070057D2|nr:NeuD/PglB/VioB family sugar acetyltransferase [Microbacterium sp. Root166]KQZ84829.1 hypothetical protein ASD56_00040 [Microbacterium sp. Root166]
MRIVIAGAGGHGREIHTWLTLSPVFMGNHDVRDIVFANDVAADLLGAPLLGSIRDFVPERMDRVIVAIGDPDGRAAVVDHLSKRGARFLTFAHDDALVAPTAVVGEGAVICPRAVVSANARLGAHVHLNVGAVVSHDADVGDFSTLSPGSYVLGGASVGTRAYVGAGAVVLPRRRLGDGVTVGAQAAVIGDFTAGTLVGVPARRTR